MTRLHQNHIGWGFCPVCADVGWVEDLEGHRAPCSKCMLGRFASHKVKRDILRKKLAIKRDLKAWREANASTPKRVAETHEQRYDDIYFEGVEWLNKQ